MNEKSPGYGEKTVALLKAYYNIKPYVDFNEFLDTYITIYNVVNQNTIINVQGLVIDLLCIYYPNKSHFSLEDFLKQYNDGFKVIRDGTRTLENV